jgi:15-cis-phytoene synthase
VIAVADADRRLALNYVGASRRAALSALWALDEKLERIIASTTQPLVGQMRLTWWHNALCALDTAPPPAEPLLMAIYAEMVPLGITGAQLAALVEGWEILLETPVDAEGLTRHADARGGYLFTLSQRVSGGDDAAAVGRSWALAGFARHCATRELAALALSLAAPVPALAGLAKPLRILGSLTRHDVRHGAPLYRPRWTILRAALA